MGSTIRLAVVITAACGLTAAIAQPAVSPGDGTSTLGSGKSRGKLLTREELRACLVAQARQKAERAALVQREQALDRQKAEILVETEAIKAARQTLDRTSEEAVKVFSERAYANDGRIGDFNQSNASLAADAAAWQAHADQWKTQCGDRRYREDDQIDIKRGL